MLCRSIFRIIKSTFYLTVNGQHRNFGRSRKKEFTVTPFCNLSVNLPCDIAVVSLDVHKYTDCNRVLVELTSESSIVPNLNFNHDIENVIISTSESEFPSKTLCKIEAPIKANISINAVQGNVSVFNFNGDAISIKTVHGHITAGKCFCKNIAIGSTAGDITCLNTMQAAKISLKTSKDGSITTGRLQGNSLHVQAENGNIKTESSYCTKSNFFVENGCIELCNAHKDCAVTVSNSGSLHLSSFDGILHAIINKGNANVQLSRIEGDSSITFLQSGSLILKIAESCLNNTKFTVISKNAEISDSLQANVTVENEYIYLIPNLKTDETNFLVKGEHATVLLQELTLMEMFNIKLKPEE